MPETTLPDALQQLLAPCEGSPAGQDARYDPLHESVRRRVASLDTPQCPEEFDWKLLASDAKTVLADSKDLVIASCLAFALGSLDGLEGYTNGLLLMTGMLGEYWEGLFPKRSKARTAAVRWLVERVVPRVTEITPATHAEAQAFASAAEGLARAVSVSFEDSAPGMRPLQDAGKRLLLSAPEATDSSSAISSTVAAGIVQPATPDDDTPTSTEAEPDSVTGDGPEPIAENIVVLLDPIEGGAGTDARYELTHEEIRTTVAQLDAPTGGEIEWPPLAAACEDLLRNVSKDFLIAAIWGYAQYQIRGLGGLSDGLLLLTELFDRYWEDGYPRKKRAKARVNAVSWLTDRLSSLSDRTLSLDDTISVRTLEKVVAQFSRSIGEHFDDRAPAVRPLQNEVQRMVLSLPKPEQKVPEPAKAVSPPSEVSATTQPSASIARVTNVATPEAVSLADSGDLPKFLLQTGTALYKAARSLFKANPKDPISYRLSRIALYLHIAKPPPATDGKTTLPPPPAKLETQLQTLHANAKWEMLLEEAESATKMYRFWFDLQFYVGCALGQLGYLEAQEAVVTGTRALLSRMPSLLESSFATGAPLCGSTARSWVTNTVLSTGEGRSESGVEEPTAFVEARKLALEGSREEALVCIHTAIETGKDEMTRFSARLLYAEVLGASAASLVVGLCSAMVMDVDRFGLDMWQPSLSARLYTLHLGALQTLAKNPKNNVREQQAVVRSRLCRVAPLMAAKWA